MKGECNLSTTKKSLNDLTLLDRFLFAEAVEDPEIMRLILEIILGQEIRLDGLPQTEKETRNSPLYRHIRLDVWARDLDNRVYDTEVQSRNTGNLPRRSRYYQGQIDTKLLKPGTVDFNLLSDIVLILIAPFVYLSDVLYGEQRDNPRRRRGADFSQYPREESAGHQPGTGAAASFHGAHQRSPFAPRENARRCGGCAERLKQSSQMRR